MNWLEMGLAVLAQFFALVILFVIWSLIKYICGLFFKKK